MFCCCLIVNYGVALHCMCYTIVCIVPWHYPFVELFKGHKIGVGFFWVLLEALGIFLGLDFWLHSIIPVTWKPEYPPWVSPLTEVWWDLSIYLSFSQYRHANFPNEHLNIEHHLNTTILFRILWLLSSVIKQAILPYPLTASLVRVQWLSCQQTQEYCRSHHQHARAGRNHCSVHDRQDHCPMHGLSICEEVQPRDPVMIATWQHQRTSSPGICCHCYRRKWNSELFLRTN